METPTQADIRRKNANFAARAVAGKKTTRPAKKGTHTVGTWVLAGMLFLLVGGTAVELIRLMFFGRS